MAAYIARRIVHMVPLLLGISLVSFGVMQLAPGDFLDELRLDPVISPETIEQMRASFGLDQPAYVQYLRWLWRILHLDFGYSFSWKVPVTWLISTRLFNTLVLSISALLFAWTLAIPIGVYAATHRYSTGDKILTILAFLGISIPNFFFALLLLYVAYLTGWLPIGGMTSIDFEFLPWWEKAIDLARHLVIPTVVLGTATMALLMRQMRAQMLEVLQQDFIRTARAKGLAGAVVTWRHAVRNAINPLISIFGLELGGILSGAAVTEIVVGWPGMGQLTLDALLKKDYYLVMGILMMSSVMLIIGNLVADLLLAWSDPRIRYD
jgi:peptide/nickel transport system permease protein